MKRLLVELENLPEAGKKYSGELDSEIFGIDDEEVTLYLMNAKAPCFIKDDQGSYIYLILPVNFNASAN